MKNPINWFEIYVDDIERATAFYKTVLKTEFTDMSDPTNQGLYMRGFSSDINSHGASGSLIQMNGMKAGGNSVIVYFYCDDCSIEESRVVDAGGKIMKPKMSIGEYGSISICVDTEGNLFGLHSMK